MWAVRRDWRRLVGAAVIALGWLSELERAHPAVTVALGPPGGLVLNRLLRWSTTGSARTRFTRKALDKVFPDHWSFMLGEVALYCFVVLVRHRHVPHVLLPPERRGGRVHTAATCRCTACTCRRRTGRRCT